jgi:hypothetical protein
MTFRERDIPSFSNDAIAIFADIRRHGGSMRVVPLFRRSSLDGEAFISAIRELQERRWVNVNWRHTPRAVLPPGMPERCREVDRVTSTRFGRWRYAVTWPRCREVVKSPNHESIS